MFGPGRKWHSAKVELVGGHPTVLINNAAPRPDQHTTKTRERHFGERDKQPDQARRS